MVPVITTINRYEDTYVGSLLERGYEVVVVSDLKTPMESWQGKDVTLIHDQSSSKWDGFRSLLPHNHYCRKNLGYLFAADLKAPSILDTDDDTYLTADINQWSDLPLKTVSGAGVPNILTEFWEHSIWARGYPLELINAKQEFVLAESTQQEVDSIGLVQSLVNGDPDVDSIFRLSSPYYTDNIEFYPNKGFVFPSGIYTQGNTQATLWIKPELFHLAYIPMSVSFRFCDILKLYVAQRCMWELGYNMSVVSPLFAQKRNAHNYMSDFRSEYSMFECLHRLLTSILPNVRLKGEMEDLITVYQTLEAEHIVKKEELVAVKKWVEAFESL